MGNGKKHKVNLIMDDLALIVEGLQAAEVMDALLTNLTDKTYLSDRDRDALYRELRRMQLGLNAGRTRRKPTRTPALTPETDPRSKDAMEVLQPFAWPKPRGVCQRHRHDGKSRIPKRPGGLGRGRGHR